MANNNGINTEVISSHEEFLKKLTSFVGEADKLRVNIDKTVKNINRIVIQIGAIGKTVQSGLNDAFSLKGKNPIKGFFDSLQREMNTAVTKMTTDTVNAINKMSTEIATAMTSATAKMSGGSAGGGGGRQQKSKLVFGANKVSSKDFDSYIKDAQKFIQFREAQQRMYEKFFGKQGRTPGAEVFGRNNLSEKEFDAYIKNAQAVIERLQKSIVSTNRMLIAAYEENKRFDTRRNKMLTEAYAMDERYNQRQLSMINAAYAENSRVDAMRTRMINAAYAENARFDTRRMRMISAAYAENDRFDRRRALLSRRISRNVAKVQSFQSQEAEITYGVNNLTEQELNSYITNAKRVADKMEKARALAATPKAPATYASGGAGSKLNVGDAFEAFTGKDSSFLDSPNKIADILRGVSSATGSVMENMVSAVSTAINNMKVVVGSVAAAAVAAGAAFVGLGYQIKNWGTEILLTTEKVRGFNIALLGMMKTQGGVKQFMNTAFEVAKDFPVGFEQTFQIAKSMSLIQPLRPLLRDANQSKETMDKVFQIVMALNAMEPEWGIQGAMFTLKEALAGDMMSMKRRYEIPINLVTTLDGKRMADVKNDPSKMLEGLYGYLTNIYDKTSMQSLARQFGNILGQIESSWFQFKSKIGEAGFYDAFIDDLVKVKMTLQDFMKSTEVDGFAKRISNALFSGYKALRDFSMMIVKEVAGLFGYKIDDSVRSYAEALTNIVEGFTNITIGLIRTAEANKGKIVGWIKYVYEAIRGFIERSIVLVREWMPTIRAAVEGIVDALKNIKDKLGISDEGALRGMFYVWLFGPGNIVGLVASTLTTIAMLFSATLMPSIAKLIAEIGVMKTALRGVFAVTPVLAIAGSIYALKDVFVDIRDWFIGAGTVVDWFLGRTPEQQLDRYAASLKEFSAEYEKLTGKKLTEKDLVKGKREEIQKMLREKRQSVVDQYEETGQRSGLVKNAINVDDMRILGMESSFNKLTELFDKMGELADGAKKSADVYAKKTDLSFGERIASYTNRLFMGLPASMKLKEMSKPEVSFDKFNDTQKIAVMNFMERMRTGFNVQNTEGYSISRAYDPKGGTDHRGANAFDIPGSALGGIKSNRKFYEELFEAASNKFGGLLRFEEKKKGEYFDWNIINELKAQYKDVIVKTEGLKVGDAAIHVRVQNVIDEGSKDIDKANEELITGKIKGLQRKAILAMRFANNIQTVNPPAPPSAMDELRKVVLSEYVDFQKNMSSITSSYKENVFQNEFGKILETFNEKNVLFGEAMINNIKSNTDVALKQYDDVLKKVEQSGGPTNVFDQNLVEYAKKAKANIIAQSQRMLSRAPTLSLEAVKSQLRDKKEVFKYTGVNTFDEIGMMSSLLNEQIAKQTYEGTLDIEKLRNLNDVLGNIQYLMRSGLGLKEAAEELSSLNDDTQKGIIALNIWNSAVENFKSTWDVGGMAGAVSAIATLALTTGKKVDETVKALMPAIEKTMQMQEYVQAEKRRTGRAQFESAIGLAPSSSEVDRLVMEANTAGIMNRTLYRSSLDRKIAMLGEGETRTMGDSFKLGIDRALTDWKNFSEQFVEMGTQAVTELTGIFENNFFDFLSGKIRGLGGLISGVLGSVKDMILKMVSKLLALQTMKIILGVNVDSSGNFVTGGGAQGGGTSASGSIAGVLGGIAGSVGGAGGMGGIVKNIVSGAVGGGKSGGGKGTSIGGLLSGSKLTTAFKYLTSSSFRLANTPAGAGFMKGFQSVTGINPALLAGAAAVQFLTSPGRLFGGTIDKTGAAKSMYANNEEWRKALESSRSSYAAQYMYGGGNIAGYQLAPTTYKETKSGDGIFKKKTKTGQVDTRAFVASIDGYYKELFGSAMSHYAKQRDIDKLRESSEGSALKEEIKYKQNYLNLVRSEYDKLSGKTNKTQDEYKQMDDLRDKIAQTFDDVIKSEKAMAEAFREEALKKKEYDLFMQFGLGKNDMALEQGMLAVQKQRLDAMEGTSAWYDANMEYLTSSKDLAEKLRDTVDSMNEELKSAKIGVIRGSGYAGAMSVASTLSSLESNYQKIISGKTGTDIRNQIGSVYGITGTKNFETANGAGGNRVMVQRNQYGMIPQYQFGSNEEAIRYYETINKQAQTRLYGENVAGEYAYRKSTLFSDTSTTTLDDLSRKSQIAKAIRDVELVGAGATSSEEYFNALRDFYEIQFTLADEIKGMMSEGLVERASTDIVSLMSASVEDFRNVFVNIQKQFREKQFTQNILETAKSFESGSQFTDIVSQISGMGGLGGSQGYIVDLLGGMGAGSDPYQAWYNYALETTKTKIRNAEVGGDEMFTAYNDLFSLLSENADHLKQKAEATNAKMEASLDAIEETLKVRLAEERKSLKGDVYFMDTSTYDISPTQIQALRDKLKNNDPDAYMLLEEIKRKVSGTSR